MNGRLPRRFVPSMHLVGIYFLTLAISPPMAIGQETEPSGATAVHQIESAFVQAIAKAEKSVVAIAKIRRDEAAPRRLGQLPSPFGMMPEGSDPTSIDYVPREFGAGVVVDKTGLILTSLHVLGEVSGNDYVVWVQRRPYVAKVKAADPWLDVAILQISANDLTPMTLGDAKTLKKGQIVVALGNPRGIARDGEPSAIWGMIANLARAAPANRQSRARGGRETLHHYGTLIQLDTKLPLGCSGGAIVNLKGELIGLATTLTALPGEEQEAGLAIPIDEDFKASLESLKAGKLPEYGFLGLAPQPLPLRDRQAGKRGAIVEDVVPGAPAAKSGIKPGDIVTQVNATPVQDDLHLIRLVSALPAESQVRLQVQRDPRAKKPFEVDVVLSKKYQESARESFAEQQAGAWRGMRVEYATATPAFRDLIRHIDPQGCIAVLDVERDSPAWKAGLRGGQFISHVNDARVSTPKEFWAAVEDLQEEVALRVTMSPDGELVRRVAAP